MIPYLQNRETSFLTPTYQKTSYKNVRNLRCHNIQGLQTWMKSMHILDGKNDYNMYYSLAAWGEKGIPYSSLSLKDRDFKEWTKNNYKSMTKFDYIIDIDCDNHNEVETFAYLSAESIKNFLDKCETPYHLKFSGRGWNFLVDFKYFFELNHDFIPESRNSIYNFYREIAERLNERFSSLVDTGLNEHRRLTKIPFSLALYDGKEYMCKPIESDAEFENFELRQMLPIHNFKRIKDIEDHLFQPEGNIYKLLKELGIKW